MHELCPVVDKIRGLHRKRPLLFTPLRHDGAGISILHMIFNAAYAHLRGWVYVGAIKMKLHSVPLGETKHDVDFNSIARFIFGRDAVFDSDCMLAVRGAKLIVHYVKTYTSILDSLEDLDGPPYPYHVIFLDSYSIKDYDWMFHPISFERHAYTPYSQINTTIMDPLFRDSFTMRLRSEIMVQQKYGDRIKLLFQHGVMSVAMHLRRGDVNASLQGRYTPDSYYYNIMEKIRNVEPTADIHVFTSLEGQHTPESFNKYNELGAKLHFENTVDERMAWYNMMNADMLIMAKSSFSEVPALLNPNCVVYDPNYLGMMDRWIIVDNFTDDYIRSCSR